MSPVDLILRGGPVLFVLVLVSILALGIVTAKFYQFYKSGLKKTDFIEPVLASLQNKDTDSALSQLKQTVHPVARVMETAILASKNEKPNAARSEIEQSGSAEIRNLESYLRGLSAIAHLSPLLGLLGTVTGMIQAFQKLQTAGTRVDPSLLAGGIWEALLTTAAGMAIAIPSMAVLYYLEGQVDRVRADMKDASVKILKYSGLLDSNPQLSRTGDDDYGI